MFRTVVVNIRTL